MSIRWIDDEDGRVKSMGGWVKKDQRMSQSPGDQLPNTKIEIVPLINYLVESQHYLRSFSVDITKMYTKCLSAVRNFWKCCVFWVKITVKIVSKKFGLNHISTRN